MTKEEIVKALVEQVVAMGFKIRLITLDAGFYTVDVLNFISHFNYIVAVPAWYVKVFEEFDGDYMANSK
jgi:putative transposase